MAYIPNNSGAGAINTGHYSNDLITKFAVDEYRDDKERLLKSEIDYLTRRLAKINTQHRASMRKREQFAKRIRAKQAKLVALLLTE